jgi:hypothetical protein
MADHNHRNAQARSKIGDRQTIYDPYPDLTHDDGEEPELDRDFDKERGPRGRR